MIGASKRQKVEITFTYRSNQDAGDNMKSENNTIKKNQGDGVRGEEKSSFDNEVGRYSDIGDTAQVFKPQRSGKELEEQVASDEFLEEVNMDIAKQICDELNPLPPDEEKKKIPRWVKIIGTTFGVLLCLTLVFIGTPWGRQKLKKMAIFVATEYAYGKMDYDDGKDAIVQDPTEEIDTDIKNTSETTQVVWNGTGFTGDGARREDYVVNVLLLGEEAIGSGTARGRTDVMMIASMNTKDKSFKLTSLMRDTLVQIPDYEGKSYRNNKLNVAYEIGGVQLLYETIAQNFDIALDGYALVGFENFEQIVDILDGVEVELSQTEANYLNRTNYISNKAYRNVRAGKQILNGNQAVGFCRIRHVPTVDNLHYDYGRTSRQRVVLNEIFDKCKTKSTTDLAFLMNELLPYVKTDITKEQFRNYLEIGLSLNIQDLQNARIPVEGAFEEGYERGMAVLIPNLEQNIQELHKFIFGSIESFETTQSTKNS